MIIDGTEQQIISHVEKNLSTLTRSGKKSTNTVTKLPVSVPKGN